MNKIKFINVVIPVYNSEKYLNKCFSSLLNQTYPWWRAVVVDDGSTDKSAEICMEYSKLYPQKIRFYKRPHLGPGATRNYGIENSCEEAEYCFFLDSDDYIENDTFSLLVSTIERSQADIAVCGYVRHHGNRQRNISYYKSGIITPQEVFVSLLEGDEIGSFSCNKLFAYHLFENLRYPEDCFYEDVALFYKVVLCCKKISVIQKPLYHYVWHKTSVVASTQIEQLMDLKAVVSERNSFILNSFPELIQLISLNELKINIHIWNRICKCFGKSATEKGKAELEVILNNDELFPFLNLKNRIMMHAIKFSPKLYARCMLWFKNFFFLK